MAQLTAYGKRVKKRMIDMDKSSGWLINEVHQKTGMYIDSGYVHKILTGQRAAPKIVEAINEVLGIK